jgi:hypothetical protein
MAHKAGLKPGQTVTVSAGGDVAYFPKGMSDLAGKLRAAAARRSGAMKKARPGRRDEYMAVRRSNSGKSFIVATHRPDRSHAPTRTTIRTFRLKAGQMTHVKTAIRRGFAGPRELWKRPAKISRRQRMGHGWNGRVKRPRKGYQRFK